ncbi:MAG: NUDIX hydrolase [Candidatus Levyibacteriota bacterium]
MKYEFSAGGIVFKKVGDKISILIAQHSQHHGWVFPKGLIGDHIKGESKEETALREVKEETGITGKILGSLSPITYWYVFDKEKIKKTVYYFLMEYISGDVTEHDFEMENVEWIPIDEIESRLTYKSDKQIWKESKSLIA